MTKDLSKNNLSVFEQIKHIDENGNEFWMARQLSKLLDYTDFRNFSSVIVKAIVACKNSGHHPNEHLVEANEVLVGGNQAKQTYSSYKLSRYACYLIVQNADPTKEKVALGQSYFAVQTRLQELQQMDEYNRLNSEEEKRLFLRNEMIKHNTYLAAAAKNAGVQDGLDYAIFQNHGYAGLYGGLDAKGIHKKKDLKKANTY
jgi:DNA-damage-inducible protein D